jgi:hypothetical protein
MNPEPCQHDVTMTRKASLIYLDKLVDYLQNKNGALPDPKHFLKFYETDLAFREEYKKVLYYDKAVCVDLARHAGCWRRF